ncbi:beta-ketoacyl synthase N-terminal-like domain-containing protein [Acanthopleuribacter pedis]|uniref:Beta-ketoacyl synthase-like N-terminal domain-containing protein n=1 Tax=Acanthopleuribacter pedis TaxID=442870 RepID=A0A8J7QJB3_9BACT|nr:beta-ketoacyl synthase N-terminal-like domain-containing protein [Acanthopleuribacter pedis]MBO1319253.1 hypothetical protein [Acanthopleuribacter pedis]
MKTVITAVNSTTPVGTDALATAHSVRTGMARIEESSFWDRARLPVDWSRIEYLSDYEVNLARQQVVGNFCLDTLIEQLSEQGRRFENLYLLVGLAHPDRPGPAYAAKDHALLDEWCRKLAPLANAVSAEPFQQGHAAVAHAADRARQILADQPESACLIGGYDSLLDPQTLQFFSKADRLLSEAYGRQHGFAPGEGCAFFLVETEERARRAETPILAELAGAGHGFEPGSIVSDQPNTAKALTDCCRAVLEAADPEPVIAQVYSDLNGEYFRTKEWNYVSIRLFGQRDELPVHHPAEYYGTVGAAGGAVLANLATIGYQNGWIQGDSLIFCSDDHGDRGAILLRPAPTP